MLVIAYVFREVILYGIGTINRLFKMRSSDRLKTEKLKITLEVGLKGSSRAGFEKLNLVRTPVKNWTEDPRASCKIRILRRI